MNPGLSIVYAYFKPMYIPFNVSMRINSFSLVQTRQKTHLIVTQIERIAIEILDQLRLVGCCRQHHDALLGQKPQGNLGPGFSVFLCQVLHCFIVFQKVIRSAHSGRGQWSESAHLNIVPLAERDEVSVLEVDVRLDLVDHRPYLTGIQNPLQLSGIEIGYADRFHFTSPVELFEAFPSVHEIYLIIGYQDAVLVERIELVIGHILGIGSVSVSVVG